MEKYAENNVQHTLASPNLTAQLPPLLCLNHVSFVCKSVAESVKFYVNVLGFVVIKRPSSFNFKGAWLHGHGIGIHLLECDTLPAKKSAINTKANHISFECSDMTMLKKRLEDMKVEFITALVEDSGIAVDQLFFHDPDGRMIEICNCQNFPVIPLSASPTAQPGAKHDTAIASRTSKRSTERQCARLTSCLTDELPVDLMKICT